MLRTAAYARVSTDKEDQINSLANQRKYFEEYIKSKENLKYAGVYYDEGVTGTQTKKRSGFNKMIEDGKTGKIDLILTKEVSRFARNTIDTLKYTRVLKEYGVGVVFINDNIDTRDNDGEFRLSIMASVAQEESRKTSERVKWGQRRAMENGVVFGNNSIFGFNISGGNLIVNQIEAEIVRLIFNKYTNEGKGSHIIARELYEAGIKPPRSSSGMWSGTMIMRVLRNEKYVGDLIQGKYVTKDYLTHKKEKNDGEKVFIKNHHEAIIDREMWNRTREELDRRSELAKSKCKYSNRYWCSGKIICGECGAKFIIRRSRKSSGEYIAWTCKNRAEHGRRKDSEIGTVGCGMRTINNKSLLECMRFVTEKLCGDFDTVSDEIVSEIAKAEKSVTTDTVYAIERDIRETENKKLRVLDSYFSGQITDREKQLLCEKYDKETEHLKKRLEESGEKAQRRNPLLLKKQIGYDALFSQSVYGEIIDKIIVYEKYMILCIKHLDFGFRIVYSSRGRKENYITMIEECSSTDI